LAGNNAKLMPEYVPNHRCDRLSIRVVKETRVRKLADHDLTELDVNTPHAMGWATPYIEKLKRGETVQFRPRGNSMAGKIESGQLCTVVPTNVEELNVGDIVLCKVNGFQYLHLIKAIQGKRFQIGNNRV